MATQWGNFGVQMGQNIASGIARGADMAEQERRVWADPSEVDSLFNFMDTAMPSAVQKSPEYDVGSGAARNPAGTATLKPKDASAPSGAPVESKGQEVRDVAAQGLNTSMAAIAGLDASSRAAKEEKQKALGEFDTKSSAEIRQYREAILGQYEKEQGLIRSDLARLKALNKPVPREVIEGMKNKFISLESDKAKALQGIMKENMDMTSGVIAKYLATTTDDTKIQAQKVNLIRSTLGDYQRGVTAAANMDQRREIANANIELGKKRLGLSWNKFKYDQVKPSAKQQEQIADIYENKGTLADIAGMVESGQVKPGNLLKAKEYMAKTGDTIETMSSFAPMAKELALNPQEVDFLYKLQNLNVGIRRANWGTQQTGSELSQLSVGLLNSIDTPQMFLDKAKAAATIMERAEESIARAIITRPTFAADRVSGKGQTPQKQKATLTGSVQVDRLPEKIRGAVNNAKEGQMVRYNGKVYVKSGGKLVPQKGK